MWIGPESNLQEREFVTFSKLDFYQIVIFRPPNKGRNASWRLGFFRLGHPQYQNTLDLFAKNGYTRRF